VLDLDVMLFAVLTITTHDQSVQLNFIGTTLDISGHSFLYQVHTDLKLTGQRNSHHCRLIICGIPHYEINVTIKMYYLNKSTVKLITKLGL